MNVAVYYGSTYGNTADAAERIAASLSERLGVDVPVHEAGWSDVEGLAAHDLVLVGCSTWDGGELQADWRGWFPEIARLDLRGTTVALFGTGDQVAYADTFVDALGILAAAFEERGATLVGRWPAHGYAHVASKAQRGATFVGLALDEDNQPDETPGRIAAWTERLVAEWSARTETEAAGASVRHEEGTDGGPAARRAQPAGS